MYKRMERPMVTFSTWKSWYLLLHIFIRYKSFLLVANALRRHPRFCINFSFLVFLILLGLDFISTKILFSIEHHWINLCWITALFHFCLTLRVCGLQIHNRNIQTLLTVMASCVSGIDLSNERLLLGRRHFVVGRFNSSQLGFFVVQVQISPAQQEGHGVFTKLEEKKKQKVELVSTAAKITHILQNWSASISAVLICIAQNYIQRIQMKSKDLQSIIIVLELTF